jgi:hypothetical protein
VGALHTLLTKEGEYLIEESKFKSAEGFQRAFKYQKLVAEIFQEELSKVNGVQEAIFIAEGADELGSYILIDDTYNTKELEAAINTINQKAYEISVELGLDEFAYMKERNNYKRMGSGFACDYYIMNSIDDLSAANQHLERTVYDKKNELGIKFYNNNEVPKQKLLLEEIERIDSTLDHLLEKSGVKPEKEKELCRELTEEDYLLLYTRNIHPCPANERSFKIVLKAKELELPISQTRMVLNTLDLISLTAEGLGKVEDLTEAIISFASYAENNKSLVTFRLENIAGLNKAYDHETSDKIFEVFTGHIQGKIKELNKSGKINHSEPYLFKIGAGANNSISFLIDSDLTSGELEKEIREIQRGIDSVFDELGISKLRRHGTELSGTYFEIEVREISDDISEAGHAENLMLSTYKSLKLKAREQKPELYPPEEKKIEKEELLKELGIYAPRGLASPVSAKKFWQQYTKLPKDSYRKIDDLVDEYFNNLGFERWTPYPRGNSFTLAVGGPGANKSIVLKRLKTFGIVNETAFKIDSELFIDNDILPGIQYLTEAYSLKHLEQLPQFRGVYQRAVSYAINKFYSEAEYRGVNQGVHLIIDGHARSLTVTHKWIKTAERYEAETFLIGTSVDPRLVPFRVSERDSKPQMVAGEKRLLHTPDQLLISTYRLFAKQFSDYRQLFDVSILTQNNGFFTMPTGDPEKQLQEYDLLKRTDITRDGFPEVKFLEGNDQPAQPTVIEISYKNENNVLTVMTLNEFESHRFYYAVNANDNFSNPLEIFQKSPERAWLEERRVNPHTPRYLDEYQMKPFAERWSTFTHMDNNLREQTEKYVGFLEHERNVHFSRVYVDKYPEIVSSIQYEDMEWQDYGAHFAYKIATKGKIRYSAGEHLEEINKLPFLKGIEISKTDLGKSILSLVHDDEARFVDIQVAAAKYVIEQLVPENYYNLLSAYIDSTIDQRVKDGLETENIKISVGLSISILSSNNVLPVAFADEIQTKLNEKFSEKYSGYNIIIDFDDVRQITKSGRGGNISDDNRLEFLVSTVGKIARQHYFDVSTGSKDIYLLVDDGIFSQSTAVNQIQALQISQHENNIACFCTITHGPFSLQINPTATVDKFFDTAIEEFSKNHQMLPEDSKTKYTTNKLNDILKDYGLKVHTLSNVEKLHIAAYFASPELHSKQYENVLAEAGVENASELRDNEIVRLFNLEPPKNLKEIEEVMKISASQRRVLTEGELFEKDSQVGIRYR